MNCVVLLKLTFFGILTICSANADVSIKMHSELIKHVGKNETCDNQMISTGNDTDDKTEFPKIAPRYSETILLSQFTFQDNSKFDTNELDCLEVDLKQHTFKQYNWTCFRTGSGNTLSREVDWIFIDCVSDQVLSIQCLSSKIVLEILLSVCKHKGEKQTCKNLSTSNGKNGMCSNDFHIEKSFFSLIPDQELSHSYYMHVAAYSCAAFILVAFLLALLIPESKCRPTYQYDNEVELRVPLDIYKMLGVNYKPSAKRQLTENKNNVINNVVINVEHITSKNTNWICGGATTLSQIASNSQRLR